MKHNTTMPKLNELKRDWHYIDASEKILGRLANEVAELLIGKNKVEYVPNQNIGDTVVITNSDRIIVTGNKMDQKTYYRHTSYPKGLKSEKLGMLFKRDSTEVIKRAVRGMLPRNKLLKERMANLHVYKNDQHPHKAQEIKN